VKSAAGHGPVRLQQSYGLASKRPFYVDEIHKFERVTRKAGIWLPRRLFS